MSHLPPPAPGARPYPGPPPVAYDPLAVAVGNGSLLGIGYLMLRHWKTAVASWVVTATLVVLLGALRERWCEFAIAGWWVLVIAHGWFLARRQPWRRTVRAKRVTAFAVTLPILLVVGLLRFDAARIGGDVAAAREAGDCAGVAASVQKYWFGHRVADAPRTARDENDVDYCARIDVARSELETVLTGGDIKELAFVFWILGSVLKEPGQEQTVAAALDEFLTALPKNEACANVEIAAWLRTRTPDHTALDRSRAVAPQIEPNALLGCADKRAGAQQWVEARGLYQQLVDRYPKAKQTNRARVGVQKANLSIELGNVRSLVADEGYCSKPAKYSGAAPYRRGLNRTLFLGDADEYTDKLPSQWQTTDPYRATLIVCAETPTEGTPVRTCPYTSREHPGSFPVDVTFHKIAIPLKAYELRTGRLVADTTLQINGTACPRSFTFESYVEYLGYVPSTQDVITTNATIQAAFKPVVVR